MKQMDYKLRGNKLFHVLFFRAGQHVQQGVGRRQYLMVLLPSRVNSVNRSGKK